MRDPGRIGEIYRTHGAAVLRRARRILGHEAEAQEILQEIFARLVADPAPLLRAHSPMALLYTITTRKCVNRLRDESNRRRLTDITAPATLGTAAPNPESVPVLRSVLSALPEDQATAAIYRYLDGMTHQEIADLMECSRGHVINLLRRCQQTLQLEQDSPC